MAIEFRCSQCTQLLRVPETAAGKSARCPKCQALMTVPSATAIVQSTGSPPPAPNPRTPPSPEAQPGFGSPSPTSAPAPSPSSADPFAHLQPPPPKPSPDNPFSSGTFPSPSSAPPKPTSDSPFAPSAGESKSGAVNPYASPAAGAYAYSPQYFPPGERPGLPWENERQTIGCWFRTTGMVLGSPTQAFSIMRLYGGLGTPMLFGIYGLAMPVAAAAVLILPIMLLIGLTAGGQDGPQAAAGLGIIAVVGLAMAAFYVLLVPTLGALISAAIYHVLLLIVGGARQGFEATFRVVSYSQGSLFWLIIIPYLGPTIMGIWSLVLLIIGFSRAHEISGGKAALAIFLPLIVCVGAMIVGIIIAVGFALVSR